MARALILGGYGLIGAAALRALSDAGYECVGMGRHRRNAQRCFPDIPWVIRDLATLSPQEWIEILEDIDVVVNAAGALQDTAQDSLDGVHVSMLRALCAAMLGRDARLIQISAAGATPDAATAFLRSKAEGDALVAASGVDHVILRPSLVLGPTAYGGSALLRAAAAAPVHLRLFPNSQIQTVGLNDVAEAIVRATKGDIPSGTVADLTAPEPHSFPALVTQMRRWLGYGPARLTLPLPDWSIQMMGRGADVLGRMGWRPALRTTALVTLRQGVHADPSVWDQLSQQPCRSLQATLMHMPSSPQERWFSRLFLLFPLILGTLSLFWILSGGIAVLNASAAIDVLVSRGVDPHFSSNAVYGGAVLDVALGLGVLWRRTAKATLLGMVALSLCYLAGGTVLTPDLWADPMGPFVKVIPGMILALCALPMVDTR
ncbi:MAG: SDR family oxidoreductase [Thalassovita sp.]